MDKAQKVYNETRLRNIRRAKLKFLESKLQLQQKKGADTKEIHQTMKDIQKVKTELGTLTS